MHDSVRCAIAKPTADDNQNGNPASTQRARLSSCYAQWNSRMVNQR